MPGNTSETALQANVGEMLRRAGTTDPGRIQGIKDMADLLHTKFGIDFRDPKSVQAGLAKLSDLHDYFSRNNATTARTDTIGDKNAVVNIQKILQGDTGVLNGSIFDPTD